MGNNEQLIKLLIREGDLVSSSLIKAFKQNQRAKFVNNLYLNEAYENIALPIGYGQTISQPSVVAFMLEQLEPKAGEVILDIGSGSGWTTALLASVVGNSGRVIGTEIIPELVEFASQNLKKLAIVNAVVMEAEQDKLILYYILKHFTSNSF
jgi:protein-L-isoaspartate(D-aspartate) O-methyltransferase